MPRIPRQWGQYFHPQGARRATNKFAWHPGWQDTGQQPIQRVPVSAYTSKAQGVPLTGGQAQGQILGFPGASGSLTSPAAFQNVAGPLTVPVAGTYTINWSVTLSGTLSSGDANNLDLVLNSFTILATGVFPAVAGTYPQTPVTVALHAGDTLALGTPGAGTTGSVYTASITGTSLPLTLTAGPQGLANVWYPAQVTLSTTTGVLDTSTALVYLGAQGVPITLVGSVFSGNGTVALAIPSMSPGQVLIVTWTGGHPGDIAAFNIVGTMDALRTS